MSGFGIEADRLKAINSDKDSAKWRELGGIDKVAAALQTDLKSGLNSSDVDRNREAFGANRFKEVPTKTFLSILLEALKDPTLILLMFAATISTVLGAAIKEERENNAWVEGVAIWVAVILVSMVGSVNDYQKELQFKKLNAEKDAIMVKVIRDGKEQLVPNTDIVVGDVMVLDTGDKVIADGVEIEGHNLVIDEASLTGESDPIKKQPDGDFWCRSGSQVGARTCLACLLHAPLAQLATVVNNIVNSALAALHCARICQCCAGHRRRCAHAGDGCGTQFRVGHDHGQSSGGRSGRDTFARKARCAPAHLTGHTHPAHRAPFMLHSARQCHVLQLTCSSTGNTRARTCHHEMAMQATWQAPSPSLGPLWQCALSSCF